MYVDPNVKSKAELKRHLAAGRQACLLRTSPMEAEILNGRATVEGPHFPKPHTWYGVVEVKDGQIVRVVS